MRNLLLSIIHKQVKVSVSEKYRHVKVPSIGEMQRDKVLSKQNKLKVLFLVQYRQVKPKILFSANYRPASLLLGELQTSETLDSL